MTGAINGAGDCKQAELSMVVIRANGKVEDLGVVSYYHKNPFKRLMFKIRQLLRLKIKSKIVSKH